MKKKIVALFLAAVMASSVCACGEKTETSNDKYDMLIQYLEKENYEEAYREIDRIEARNEEAKAENTENADKDGETESAEINMATLKRDENGLSCLTMAQVRGCLEKVTLTMDNWQQYFDDYSYVEHQEEINAFGDVEKSYDMEHIGFGLKEGYVGAGKDIAFKFAGKKAMTTYYEGDKEVKAYREYLANETTCNAYDLEGNLLNEHDLEYYGEEVKEYYTVELSYNGLRNDDRCQYTDYECLGVMGELILTSFPEELLKEESVCLEMEDGGTTYTSAESLTNYYDMLEKYLD